MVFSLSENRHGSQFALARDSRISRLTCDDAPFLPICELERTHGEKCQSGSFSLTLSNGSLVVGRIWETRSSTHRDLYYREIEVNNIMFQLKNNLNAFNNDLFPALIDGEEFSANCIQEHAIARFSISKQGALCRHGY